MYLHFLFFFVLLGEREYWDRRRRGKSENAKELT